MAERAGGHLFPSHSSAPEESHAPAFPAPLPGNARELLPAGALRSNVAGTYGSPTNAPSLKCPLRGDQFPGDPRWLSGHAGAFFPLTAPPTGNKFVLNPCRKAHRSYSLFTILYSLVSPRRNLTPRQTRPTPRERQRIAPRRGAALKCGRNLRFPHKRPLPKRGAGVCDWLSLCSRVFS